MPGTHTSVGTSVRVNAMDGLTLQVYAGGSPIPP